jgi:hypothetical protein
VGDKEFIQQIMDGIYPQFNTPGGPYYLPTFVTNNKYDPYGPFAWDLGQLTDPQIVNSTSTICQSIDISKGGACANPNQSYINPPIPPNYPTLSLGASFLGGMKNALSERPIAQDPDGRTVIMQVDFGTLSGFPQAITLSGQFKFTNYCCCSNDGNTCASTPNAETGIGGYTATMPDPNVAPNARGNAVIVFAITALAPGVLNLQVNSVTFTPPKNPDGTPSMNVTVNITSMPPGVNPQQYDNIAMEVFNSASARQTIINSINSTLNQAGNLATISDLLTKEIDGYLRANHQYPFDGSSFAVA